MPQDLDVARYVSFESRKTNGSVVATPVWIVPFEDGYAFTTEPGAFKVRRVSRDSRIAVTVCDMRGRIAPGATRYEGVARLLDEHDARNVEALVAKKYWIGIRLLGAISLVKRIFGKGSTAGDAAIAFTVIDS